MKKKEKDRRECFYDSFSFYKCIFLFIYKIVPAL
jgi:hypothetical protein